MPTTAPPTDTPAAHHRTGILLANLGTPDAPRTPEVRRYLKEFLSDPLVLTMNPVGRWLLLNLIILPLRPRKSAEAYAAIWDEKGSPLLLHSRNLETRVREALAPMPVALGMRYGNPSLATALRELRSAGVNRVVTLPLYPQYATATTLSTELKVKEVAAKSWPEAKLEFIGDFFEHPAFVRAFAEVIRPVLEQSRPDHLLLSFHGLPESQVQATDPTGAHCLVAADCCAGIVEANRLCYRAQSFASARAIAKELGLGDDGFSVSFQSRLGRTPWIRPYTDHVLPELAAAGVKRLAVAVPSFVADCLETLEEIGIRGREQFRECGGEDLVLVPCPNEHPAFVETVVQLVREHLG